MPYCSPGASGFARICIQIRCRLTTSTGVFAFILRASPYPQPTADILVHLSSLYQLYQLSLSLHVLAYTEILLP